MRERYDELPEFGGSLRFTDARPAIVFPPAEAARNDSTNFPNAFPSADIRDAENTVTSTRVMRTVSPQPMFMWKRIARYAQLRKPAVRAVESGRS